MPSLKRALRPTPLRGGGALALVLTVLAQLVAGWLLAQRPTPPAALPDLRALSASVVVEPPLGGQPRALAPVDTVPAGGRLQLSFEPSASSWTAVLWFDGDHVVALYPDPARAQEGWTEAVPYAVPGPGQWLRLTPSDQEEFVAVVNSLRPDREIQAVLANPSPAAVRTLRERLEGTARSRNPIKNGAERFLPTPDGRAVAAPWSTLAGRGTLVLGWSITVESRAWLGRSTSLSSEQESPERSSPSAS
ncbi:MAG: hypothetical protein KDA24_16765 [Deltaproteobacteria bacterium]|nr:hypothetical protein [Deltaproteobacteria bacterium]